MGAGAVKAGAAAGVCLLTGSQRLPVAVRRGVDNLETIGGGRAGVEIRRPAGDAIVEASGKTWPMSFAGTENLTGGATIWPAAGPPMAERSRICNAGPSTSMTVLSIGSTPGGRLSAERTVPEKPDRAVSPADKTAVSAPAWVVGKTSASRKRGNANGCGEKIFIGPTQCRKRAAYGQLGRRSDFDDHVQPATRGPRKLPGRALEKLTRSSPSFASDFLNFAIFYGIDISGVWCLRTKACAVACG